MVSLASKIKPPASPAASAAQRTGAIDWTRIGTDLDAHGCAVLESLLSPDECAAMVAVYPDDSHFRSRIGVVARELPIGWDQYTPTTF